MYRVRVLETVPHRSRAVSARFERPEGFEYAAGQWVLVTLEANGEELAHPLSLSSSPTEPFLEVTKGMTGHPFAEAFRQLAPGDLLTVQGPFGSFAIPDGEVDAVLVSGGIGVTPLRSMVRFVTDAGLPARILLIYSARTEDDLVFGGEFEDVEKTNLRFRLLPTLTRQGPEWTGRTGRVDRPFLDREVPDALSRTYLVSGPPAMVESVTACLEEMGVPAGQVRREIFAGY